MTATLRLIDSPAYRVSQDGTVTRRERGTWRVLTRAELLALPVDGAVWEWLRKHGKRRPSPSGSRVPDTRTDADRDGTRMTLRLDAETTRALDALTRRWGVVRSHAIARAIAEAGERAPSREAVPDCRACQVRKRRGFEGPCPACGAEMTRAELAAERDAVRTRAIAEAGKVTT